MKIDYEAERNKIFGEKSGEKISVLLHSCCAPCSTACLKRLFSESEEFNLSLDLSVYYYNPNIDGEQEFLRRESEQKRFLNAAYGEKAGLITENYDASEFYAVVKGFEKCPEGGERCAKCFKLRLEKTARTAAEKGFEFISTTLTVSPHKNSRIINEIGLAAAKKYGVKWLYCDFKKKNGFLCSTELSNKYGLYRQNYCGCVYSKIEAEEREKSKEKQS